MQKKHGNKTTLSGGEQGILEAAEALFAHKGFDAVSMSAIARLANTSKPNIYHHFKNKNDLYLAVMKAAVRRSSALLDALEDAPGTFGQRLRGFSTGQLDNILGHKRSTQLILRETLTEGSQVGEEIARLVMGEVFSRLAAMIQQGQQENEFRKDINPELAAFIIVSTNMFFFQASPVMQHIPEVDFSQDATTYSNDVMDLLINGMLQKETKMLSLSESNLGDRMVLFLSLLAVLLSACGSENSSEAEADGKRQDGTDFHPPGGDHGPADMAGNRRPGAQSVCTHAGRRGQRSYYQGDCRYR